MANKQSSVAQNLLGCLDITLFMPTAQKRFSDTYESAVHSFFIPIFFFPLTLATVYMFPAPELANASTNTVAMLLSLRTAFTLLAFMGTVYWLASEIDRKKHFYQFVVASNWLTIPSTLAFLPLVFMTFSGGYSMEELHFVMMAIVMYTYGLTAFMAARILRLPMELGIFIAVINMGIDETATNIIHWVGGIL